MGLRGGWKQFLQPWGTGWGAVADVVAWGSLGQGWEGTPAPEGRNWPPEQLYCPTGGIGLGWFRQG